MRMAENGADDALRRWWERTAAGETVDRAGLDAAIEQGRRKVDTGAGGDLERRLLAVAYQDRWERDRTHFDDADRAIALWRRVLDDRPGEGFAAQLCGRLLAFRAERTRDPRDMAEAVRLGDLATRTLDDADSWYLSGWAHLVRAFSGGQPDGLTEALRRFGTALRRGPDDNLRCVITREQLRAAFTRYGEGRLGRAEFRDLVERGHAVLDAPGDAALPNQALLAGTLAMVEIGTAVPEGRPHDFARCRALVARYRDVELPDPHLRAELDGAQAQLDHFAGTSGDLDRGVAAVGRLAASGRFSPEQRETIAAHAALMRTGRAVEEGDLAALAAAIEQLRTGPDPAARGLAAALTSVREAGRLAEAGDETAAAAALARAQRELPGDDPAAAMLGAMLAHLTGDRSPGTGDTPAAAAVRVTALAAEVRAAAGRGDIATLRRLAAAAGPLAGLIPDDYPMLKIPAMSTAGTAELEVARRDPADHAAAARATAHLAAACALAGGPHHALWPQLAIGHGHALRLGNRPDPARSRATGRSALVALTWQALVQADTGRALEAVAAAGRHVRTVVAWCAQDAGDPAADDDLVAVLDAGRGLALNAATASRSMPERLTAAGHPGLAQEWRATAGVGAAPDDNLRVRALHALTAGSDVFTTPGPAEIRRALTATGADALVYLVPADDTRPGLAVVVPVAGRVRVLTLPELRAGRAPTGWTRAARDLGPAGDEGPAGGDAFDEVCRWAWPAAMGPLTELTDGWHLRRPARLVLVPTGALGLVPWHAAHDGRHYAIERLVLSYGVSARMFCASAGTPLRSPRSALIVGNPGGDLPHAADEAHAVHRDFHPGGTLMPHATADDVLDWIAEPGRGPSLLHLACHGYVDRDRPADAHLALAGGDLPVLRLLARARSAGLDLDRVVLSACSTGAGGSLHDEAISLATAFLAGGAHTVFGSLWAVPDADTARLMYALHHQLSVRGRPPVDALRLAQLAMLDPAREPLPDLPPELSTAGPAGPRSWAAFVHLGR
ncbi:CHAT domain-containing protein [Actinoplanes subtropicus]|uniref:CHAT domain-containing protein n=1 Tax=Actinoplanes subtropicus TaxID=543632 RepID=UPI00068C924C|nr:CHAT domain-containing protein [Actinoplanes subtropicus]